MPSGAARADGPTSGEPHIPPPPRPVSPEMRLTECGAMDLSDTFTLEELAQRLVPRAFAAWRPLSDILSGARERSLRHIKLQTRREIAKRRIWRKRLADQYGLDDQLLPKAEPGQKTLDWFQTKLCEVADLKMRQKLIVEEARRQASSEVRKLSRTRLKRARDRSGRKVLAAVSAALRANGTSVSGIEVRQTPVGVVRAERAEIAAEHLVHPHIDILAGRLTEGGRQWHQVIVHLEQMPAACGVEAASAKTAALNPNDQEIVAWMLEKQEELKGKGGKHGRDKLVPLAMKHFRLKQDVVRRAWRGRSRIPKRK